MKSSDISIRAFEASDLFLLSAIWLEASRDAHAFLGDERLRRQKKLVETDYLPGSETWVATCDREPVGFIGLIDTYVGALFVAPAFHGKGIGRTLITHALDLKGEIETEVYEANKRAHAVYEKLGFVEIRRNAKDAEGLPFPIIRLRLNS